MNNIQRWVGKNGFEEQKNLSLKEFNGVLYLMMLHKIICGLSAVYEYNKGLLQMQTEKMSTEATVRKQEVSTQI